MTARMMKAAAGGAALGLATITFYLVAARVVLFHAAWLDALEQLLAWDASTLFGASAFSGGWGAAGIGLLLDCIVALGWGAAYVAAATRFPRMHRYPVVAGACFGLVVMLVMFFVIVPLTHARQMSHTPTAFVNVAIAHTLFFGVPIALLATRAARYPAAS